MLPKPPYLPEYQKPLARLCLVNHYFLEIARPLLYSEIFLEGFDEQLFHTLLNMKHCSRLVKGIFIVMDRIDNSLEMTALAYLMSQLGALETVKIIDTNYGTLQDFARVVQRHQIRIKHFDLRDTFVGWRGLLELLSGWEALETLVIDRFLEDDADIDSSDTDLACKLRRFVSHFILTISIFERILHSSWETLVILAFPIDSEYAALDLHRLKNLHTLRIKLDDDFDSAARRVRLACGYTYMEEVRVTLRSVQSLSVRTLSITTEDDLIANSLVTSPLLDLLPPSLYYLGTNFELLDPEGVNYPEVVQAKQDGRLAHLQWITIYPADGDEAYTLGFDPGSGLEEERKARDLGERLKIPTSFHRIRVEYDTPHCTP